ncbi:hypothetical protein N7509_010221 [Penicillium cosmopolitanum]|uniref:Uncharacterized protein n=1 Tax=Penicillium cosmopolitanum TaxID=1131564 RepID=A0A9X0B4E4_9EURO|nr:uncharacterized protein N7509_010221 [Penicillium cosmopolitanum]KAJ5387680.1 hypothetical protein N7509_010221 [Penicillium cosmopolitanum]
MHRSRLGNHDQSIPFGAPSFHFAFTVYIPFCLLLRSVWVALVFAGENRPPSLSALGPNRSDPLGLSTAFGNPALAREFGYPPTLWMEPVLLARNLGAVHQFFL